MQAKNSSRARQGRKGVAEKVIGFDVKGGREKWRVSYNGKVRTVVTSRPSVIAMDKAVELYGRALKRLADR